jgi:hypothetical protein
MQEPWIDHDKVGGLFCKLLVNEWICRKFRVFCLEVHGPCVIFLKALVCGICMNRELIIVKFGVSVEGDDVKLSERWLK